MSLFVKWGNAVRIADGQVLYALGKTCGRDSGNFVPVPEVYGWRTDGDETFLYMEAISGKTLEDAWPETIEDDRLRICSELKSILYNLRSIEQDPRDRVIDLPDNSAIVFTHGDLHPTNILISNSPSGQPYVAALIDWEQSGWLPDHWEDCKAHWAGSSAENSYQKYLPLIVEKNSTVQEAFSYYTDPTG